MFKHALLLIIVKTVHERAVRPRSTQYLKNEKKNFTYLRKLRLAGNI